MQGSYADGAVSFWFGTKRVFHKCRIVNSSGPQHFGGMNFEQPPENESQISECEYTNCSCSINGDSCKGCGGALGIVNPPPHLFITCSKFQNNRAVRHGGAIMCFLALPASSFRCRFLFFSNNSGQSQGGSDIYTDKNFAGKLDSSQFEACYSFSMAPRFVYCNSDGSYPDAANKPYWLPTPSFPNIYVKNGGYNTNDYGNSTDNKECAAIGFAIALWTPIFNQKIIVNGGTYTEDSLDISDRVIVADSQTSIPKIITNVNSGTFCLITNGSFSASNFIFVHNSSASSNAILFSIKKADGVLKLIKCTVTAENGQGTTFSKSLFAINDGHLIFDQTTVTAIKASKPVLSLIFPREFTTTQSVFSQISRTNGNGSVLEATLEAGQILHLANFSLTECSCSEGNGGGMWVYMKAGSTFSLGNASGSFVFDRGASANELMKFTSCSANSGSQPKCGCGGGIYLYLEDDANDFVFKHMSFNGCSAQRGSDIFIDANDLPAIISNATVAFETDFSHMDALCGLDRHLVDKSSSIPLLLFLLKPPTMLYVNDTGVDYHICGFIDYPCRTISYACKRRAVGYTSVSVSITSTCFSEELILHNHSYYIYGHNLNDPLIVSSSGIGTAGLITSGVDTTLSLLNFALPSTLGTHSSFIAINEPIDGSSLIAKECTFEMISVSIRSQFPVYLNYNLIESTFGKLSIKNCDVSVFDYAKSLIMISSSVSSVNIESTNIGDLSGTKESALVCAKSTGLNNVNTLFVLNSTQLRNVNQSVDCPASIIKDTFSAWNILIANSTFQTCIAQSSLRGGGSRLCLSMESNLEISDTTFSACMASAEGRGGGLYLECADTTNPIPNLLQKLPLRMSSIRFINNEAKFGKDIFINCFNISEQIDKTLFNLEFFQPSLQTDTAINANDISEQDTNLIPFVESSKEYFVFLSLLIGNDRESECGTSELPCQSISVGATHMKEGPVQVMFVLDGAVVVAESTLKDVTLKPFETSFASIQFIIRINLSSPDASILTLENEFVMRDLQFVLSDQFDSDHKAILNLRSGLFDAKNINFISSRALWLNPSIFFVTAGDFRLVNFTISDVWCGDPMFFFSSSATNVYIASINCSKLFMASSLIVIDDCPFNAVDINCTSVQSCQSCVFDLISIKTSDKNVSITKFELKNISLNSGEAIGISSSSASSPSSGSNISIFSGVFEFISRADEGPTSINAVIPKRTCNITIGNCSFIYCISTPQPGSIAIIEKFQRAKINDCNFYDLEGKMSPEYANEICKWNGSFAHIASTNVEIHKSLFTYGLNGGLTMYGNDAFLKNCEFKFNGPNFDDFWSVRRNILCQGSGILSVENMIGENITQKNSSLWILNDGCELWGFLEYMPSVFFIPTLFSFETEKNESEISIIINGSMLIPCNLSFEISIFSYFLISSTEYTFDPNDFKSEREVHARIPESVITSASEDAEVRISILFGNTENKSSTNYLVLKNVSTSIPSVPKSLRDLFREQGWSLIAFIACASVLIIVIIILLVLIAVFRKKLKDAKKGQKSVKVNTQVREMQKRKRGENHPSNEMSEMPSDSLERSTIMMPLLRDDERESSQSLEAGSILGNDLANIEESSQAEGTSTSILPSSLSFCVISTKEPFEVKKKKNLQNLFSMMHNQNSIVSGARMMNSVNWVKVAKEVAKLLEHLISIGDERVQMMAEQLCPYTIFVGKGNENEIFVLAEELKDEKQKNEMKQWRSPELNNENEEDEEDEEDEESDRIEKEVVYELGLILQEMTTGKDFSSECCACETQEMVRDEIRRTTEVVCEDSFVRLIEKMTTSEKNDRPSLKRVIEALKEIEGNRE
ncbi:uncharacterized protein MONOS_12119 [Monocercomonoides exilis]|uniref:uncharacterized protein n=1 Tax=Monocercomonoides exilis TaxID=2049356 RepID=UPI003559D6E0|nr:hypothetical protein MONOS_12119 [Monocercomonoides exilis]|eukprot:MONOS_12119.1-p1 / transcript=MONOS_12119.1 / gene=MONOS_12119 / organism=Monocercomonoides_exilis_PA203 / gene_product=unspecified product / transcript_product=unspecified product / location=Mono_scaffold00648:7715-13307(-) / protein_length=1832 / sequence_SO=supercontig / SO=protein_coding / is_pseudo=false